MNPLYPQQLHKAGCIPWYKFPDGKVRLFLMKPSDPSYGGDRFQIAKGVIDALETPIMTAFREAEEELGCQLSNIDFETVVKITDNPFHVFIGKVIDPQKMIKFHYETGEVKWIARDELLGEVRDVHVMTLLQAFNRIEDFTKES